MRIRSGQFTINPTWSDLTWLKKIPRFYYSHFKMSYQIQENDRHCQECGLNIFGRSDKKFCGDQCRASFHNRIYSQNAESVRRVNRVLKRNRSLLVRLLSQGVRLTTRENLEAQGFNFDYFTHLKSENGSYVIFCYETGYFEEQKGTLKLFTSRPI